MPKKILIFNSSQEKNQALFGVFEELKNRGFLFFPGVSNFGFELASKFRQFLFIIILPALFFIYFFYLAYCKFKKIKTIICLNINEKIVITLAAKIFKIKIIWIEDADSIVLKDNIIKPIFWLYKFFSKKAAVLTFSGFIKNKLEQKKAIKKDVILVNPGIKLDARNRQDNIFEELARTNNAGYKRKFFTVGTSVNLNKKQKIENLFGSIKICQTVIPGVQMVIAGDGEERKNLSWLNKKMGLSNVTWFVGEQKHLKKWLDSFDVFVVACEAPVFSDILTVIKAMAAGLPILCPCDLGLEGIVGSEICYGENNAETLAGQIIEIWRDKKKRLRVGQAGQERVEKYFTVDRMVEELEKIIV